MAVTRDEYEVQLYEFTLTAFGDNRTLTDSPLTQDTQSPMPLSRQCANA